jgi:hypothetical protein
MSAYPPTHVKVKLSLYGITLTIIVSKKHVDCSSAGLSRTSELRVCMTADIYYYYCYYYYCSYCCCCYFYYNDDVVYDSEGSGYWMILELFSDAFQLHRFHGDE